jgi:hypothetical protein
MPPDVAAVFAAYPPQVRDRLTAIRALILETAAATPGVGPVEETLKWGEPAYLTPATKAGSTIRLGHRGGWCAVYFICTTNLLDRFRSLFADELTFEGDRAILLDPDRPIPAKPLATCLAMALTYRLKRRKTAPGGSAAR